MNLNDMSILMLKNDMRDYESITKAIAARKNRLQATGIDPKNDSILTGKTDGKRQEGLKTIKDRLTRLIKSHLEGWEIWTEWLEDLPGLGPIHAGTLILGYYYKFVPICKHCGGDLKKAEKTYVCSKCEKVAKDGMLKYRIAIRDFPNISSWWSYCGRANDENGRIVKRKAGVQLNYSPRMKTIGYHIGESFIKKKNRYADFYNDRKRKHEKKNSDWTKIHRNNAGKNEMIKLFEAHFWQVAREIEGLEVTQPYAGTLLGHTGILKPFYWNGN